MKKTVIVYMLAYLLKACSRSVAAVNLHSCICSSSLLWYEETLTHYCYFSSSAVLLLLTTAYKVSEILTNHCFS